GATGEAVYAPPVDRGHRGGAATPLAEQGMLRDEEHDRHSAGEAAESTADGNPRWLPLPAPVTAEQDAAYRESPGAGTWRQELPGWLATLNPGRTQHEYEKAVGYFFATPGVPAALSGLSFELLLAYRGALALRATPHRDPRRGHAAPRVA